MKREKKSHRGFLNNNNINNNDPLEDINESLESFDSDNLNKPETVRTKLKNDLKKLADEMTADFDDSDMETADETETPLSKPTLIKLEKSIKAFLDNDKGGDLKCGSLGEGDVLCNGSQSVTDSLDFKKQKIISHDTKPNSIMQPLNSIESFSGLKTQSPSLPSVPESDAKSVPVSFSRNQKNFLNDHYFCF